MSSPPVGVEQMLAARHRQSGLGFIGFRVKDQAHAMNHGRMYRDDDRCFAMYRV